MLVSPLCFQHVDHSILTHIQIYQTQSSDMSNVLTRHGVARIIIQTVLCPMVRGGILCCAECD